MIVKSPEGIRLDGSMALNMMEVGKCNWPNWEVVQMCNATLFIITWPY